MKNNLLPLIDKLTETHSLSLAEYECLITERNDEAAATLAERAVRIRREIYGNSVYIRGLIEVSNICQNNCYYCGIRASNSACERYRLTPDEILSCCEEGYELGFRTFVMQGGENAYFSDSLLCDLLREIKSRYLDCAVTLSLGERSRESYEKLYAAGADRYLLRHETANAEHYAKLHPAELTHENRMRCLRDLREIGYQVGCGFMVGSPYQTNAMLAEDLKFVETFKPDMCGIGPFIPHKDTPFRDHPAGSVELTCYLLSILRLIHPPLLLPSTTALGTLREDGREMGILSGANVVMPNLSPTSVRRKYLLYNNKLSDGSESAQCKANLAARMRAIGYEIVCARGDIKK
ncbi:MAG: [FeFe] hydrogenase H-cluster radical SAM maturase HydE [Clostridia bacterium]|nr:[FeFe] hydrogenase H-cluster radical SAM maturase HydE [Clostridia bacterium]